MVISPDGRTIFGQTVIGQLVALDIATGAQTGHAYGSEYTEALAISLDGRTLATTAEAEDTIKLWDTTTFQETATLTGHTDSVTALAFSPDGHTIASSSHDNTIKLWDANTFRETVTLTGHTDAVLDLAFSPDGHTLISASRDQTLRIWSTHVDTVAHHICDVLRGRVTAEQWQQLIPDLPFEPACR